MQLQVPWTLEARGPAAAATGPRSVMLRQCGQALSGRGLGSLGPGGLDGGQHRCVVLALGQPAGHLRPERTLADRCRHQVGTVEAELLRGVTEEGGSQLVDRGGQVTYHGPGQLVAYPLLDLKRLKIGVRDYVCRIEQAVIDTLAEWNIEGARKDGAPGVYVAGAKIAALGIRVRRGCSFHGLAFNIAGDSVAPFSRINPCGFTDRGATSIERETGAKVPMDDVKRLVVKFLSEILNVRIYK